ncbi:ABC transporter permease [Arcicella rigui]|uniref:FtsX-like permease family protein n=1 Tax=Arcicella rigui TaxID=797020 RepID=A0ABU5QCE3_9BACT|nr:FtsX-like permease family protein [Arcicella rigui]MEA5140019.1 FtsX-like permease family protein [Arcicella rigui]
MLSHLFKLIWNKRRHHTLLMVEIWFSFLVLFGVMSLISYNFKNYLEPIGFEYENVWALDLNKNQDTTAIAEKLNTVFQKIRSYPEVEVATRMSNNSPFSFTNSNGNISYQKNSVLADYYTADEDFTKTLGMKTMLGNWFKKADAVAKFKPVVINKKAQEALFGEVNPIGKVIGDNQKVVGVIENFKAKGEFMDNSPCIFNLADDKYDYNKVLIKVKPGTDANFEAKLTKEIASVAKEWTTEVSYLTDQRQNQHNLALVPVIIFLIITVFLLVNVAMGLFGILNLNIAKRREEIGVRRAMGATAGNIKIQFVGEMWVITTFGVLLGILFAVQVPLMHMFNVESSIYWMAIGLSIVILYGIVTLCAYHPSRQAANIQPAMALHEQ